jgi:hypothetical protein
MRSRCNPKHAERYPYHAGKGIKVCDAWSASYLSFKEWAVANGYSKELTIDRIDGDKDYSPDNCRWAEPSVQAANSAVLHSTNKSGYRGVSWSKDYQKWEVSIGVNKVTIKIGYYNDPLIAAKAYDTYVTKNHLPHSINGVLVEGEEVAPNVGRLLSVTNTSGYLGVNAPTRIQHLKNPWTASINKGKVRVWGGYFPTAVEAAIARDIYILENNLNSKRNFPKHDLEALLASRTSGELTPLSSE